jgi:hypothetical protein
MKKYLFIIFSLATFFQLNAQTYQPEKINKKAIKYYDQALEYLQDNAFPNLFLSYKKPLLPIPIM